MAQRIKLDGDTFPCEILGQRNFPSGSACAKAHIGPYIIPVEKGKRSTVWHPASLTVVSPEIIEAIRNMGE